MNHPLIKIKSYTPILVAVAATLAIALIVLIFPYTSSSNVRQAGFLSHALIYTNTDGGDKNTDGLHVKGLVGVMSAGQATITMKTTGYCKNECCCGDWADGFFADGTPVGGLAIAADRSIPFGTIMNVPGYGTATVKDRGGAITGNRIDLYFGDKDGVSGHQRALNYGRQIIEVEIEE